MPPLSGYYSSHLLPSSQRGGTTSSTGGLEGAFTKIAQQQLTSNTKRQAQIESIIDEVIARYQPGGTFGKSYLQQLEGQKVRDVGAGTQQLISSGLYGTTTTAGLPAKWEAEVGASARLKLEDIQMERLSQAQLGKASFLERIQEPYPDYSALMQASAAGASTGGGQSIISGGSGLPTNYNPLNDPMRHPGAGPVSGSVQGGGGGGTSTTPSGGGGGEKAPSQASNPELGAALAQAEARKNPGMPSYYGDDMWILESGIMKHMRKDSRGVWRRVG
jgi:hypothetical protein